ncbi:hypothetical protein [Nonomuraea sp. PA05]|uniref:hypothetical protein n=1 Tax=Nonomuraea sp. PA05 TaxID=2604466 RepID=UPI001651C014|nr:hypothetical protein [Nonomuraea sp. PA05]
MTRTIRNTGDTALTARQTVTVSGVRADRIDDSPQLVEATATAWAVPWWPIVAVVCGCVAVLLLRNKKRQAERTPLATLNV